MSDEIRGHRTKFATPRHVLHGWGSTLFETWWYMIPNGLALSFQQRLGQWAMFQLISCFKRNMVRYCRTRKFSFDLAGRPYSQVSASKEFFQPSFFSFFTSSEDIGTSFVALIINRATFFEYLLVTLFPDINLTAALYERCSYLHVTDKNMVVTSFTNGNS